MIRRLSRLAALLALALPVLAASPGTYLLKAVTATGAGAQFSWKNYPSSSFQASVTGGATAAVNVEVTQDPSVGWSILASFNLGGSNATYAVTTAVPNYPYVRGNLTALSGGTSPTVSLSMYPP
jgi:hypothetical protein